MISPGAQEIIESHGGSGVPHRRSDIRDFAFCPTGEGGGIDNSCSPNGENGSNSKYPKTSQEKIDKLFGAWGSARDGDLIGFRSAAEGGANLGKIAATEGDGLYIAKERGLAAAFGNAKSVIFPQPKNPMIVDEEPLHILHETDAIMEPPDKSDSPWLAANKEAVKLSKTTDENWAEKTTSGELGEALSEVLRKNGYDSVYVKSGGEEWVVLIAPTKGGKVSVKRGIYEHDEFLAHRPLTKYESRVDFKAADESFDSIAINAREMLRPIFKKIQKDVVTNVTNAIKVGLTPRAVTASQVSVGQQAYQVIRDMLVGAWREGKTHGYDELPASEQKKIGLLKSFDFDPDQPRDESGKWTDGGGKPLEVYLTPNDVLPYTDSWGGGNKGFQLKGKPGAFWKGNIIPRDQVPEVLYHVTTAKDAVEKSGYLLGQNDGGGMGGGNGLAGVSLTTSADTAEFIARELTRASTLAQTVHSREDYVALLDKFVAEDYKIGGATADVSNDLTRAKEFALHGFDANIDQYIQYRKEKPGKYKGNAFAALAAETYGSYLQMRSNLAYKDFDNRNTHPLRNPLLMGGGEATSRLKPDQISIVKVDRNMIPENALVRHGSDDFLQEVRVHADIPLRPDVKTKKHGDGQYFETYSFPDHAGRPGQVGGSLPRDGGDVTETESFKKWFGDSKVVDSSGKPMVVYHGTQAGEFDQFDPKTIGSTMGKKPKDKGFWFVDKKSIAQEFSRINPDKPKGRVVDVFLKMANPYIWDKNKELQGAAVNNAIKLGHDGVIFPDVWDGMGEQHTQYLVLAPNQIKSTSITAFDPADKRISYEWNEEDHPRGDDGKFAEKDGTTEQFAELIESPERMIEFINEIVGEDFSGSIGLRGLYSDEKIGPLPPSRVWVDGDETDEMLRGTSTLGIGDWGFTADETIAKNITKAVNDIWRYGDGNVGLVAGGDSRGGEDANELVIEDAKVVYIWRKAKNVARPFSDDTAKQYAGFEPRQAIEYLEQKALWIQGLIDTSLTDIVKKFLFEHLKGGRTLTETIMDLREAFEPWVGDPEMVAPSGMVGINTPPGTKSPDNILQAYRLENMIRTPLNEAYNQGRLAIADANDDYIRGVQLSAILDERTTAICLQADGLTIRIDDPKLRKLTPNLHFQCRTIVVYVTIDDDPVEWSTDEELDAVIRLIPEGFA